MRTVRDKAEKQTEVEKTLTNLRLVSLSLLLLCFHNTGTTETQLAKEQCMLIVSACLLLITYYLLLITSIRRDEPIFRVAETDGESLECGGKKRKQPVLSQSGSHHLLY